MSLELTETRLRDALAERAGFPPAPPDAIDTIKRRAGQIRRRRRAVVGGAAAGAGALAVALLSGPLASNQARVDVGDVPDTRPPTSADVGPVLPSGPEEDPDESVAPPATTTTGTADSDDSGETASSSPDPSSDERSPGESSGPSSPGTSATATATSPTTTTAAPAAPVACGDIAFAPASDDMATNVVATGVPCAEATGLVRTVRDQHNFVSGPRSFTAAGWACTVVTEDVTLPVGHYSCTRGDDKVTWDKT
jgi:hypothetical protein